MKVEQATAIGDVVISLTFLEAIGIYKMALAVNHPTDDWAQPMQLQYDEDVSPLSAALVVQLRQVVES